jgi:hypothetical protein
MSPHTPTAATPRARGDASDVPDDLKRAILAGECVAFVGAGFSAAAVPGWADLLRDLAQELEPTANRDLSLKLLSRMPVKALHYEAAAELLREELKDEGFEEALRRRLLEPGPNQIVDHRRELLLGIPFRAILTTNFDGLLRGDAAGAAAYRGVLRPRGHRWYDERYWSGERPQGPPVVKLHGGVDLEPASLVLGRRGYRKRLYETPGYQTFLRSVFATSTVLYLGFSFTDAYVNELRSEILALFGHREDYEPVAYALINDVSREEQEYFRRHEGIEILTYDASDGDYSGFDRWLEALHLATNPTRRLGQLLSGRHILWIDAEPRNNDFGMRFLKGAAEGAERPCEIVQVETWEEGVEQLEGQTWDLVLSHWGHARGGGEEAAPVSVAQRLLREMRSRGLEAPVIVFAWKEHADDNKRASLRLGAQAYTFEWQTLFREIERVFTPGSETR